MTFPKVDILLIEDNFSHASAIIRACKKLGHTVHHIAQCSDLEQLAENALNAPPRLIVIDDRIAGSRNRGTAILQALKGSAPLAKVLVVSVYGRDPTMFNEYRALDVEPENILQKPFVVQRFIDRVRELLG